jgi:hypothetical protein
MPLKINFKYEDDGFIEVFGSLVNSKPCEHDEFQVFGRPK